MQILTEYEWTFIRIATLLYLFLVGFMRSFYAGTVINTHNILISTGLFMVWLTLSKTITNYIENDKITPESISWTHVLFYYIALPLILVAVIMLTGFFKE